MPVCGVRWSTKNVLECLHHSPHRPSWLLNSVFQRPVSDHLRPALRKKIEGGEVLKHPYRVGRTQHRDSARKT